LNARFPSDTKLNDESPILPLEYIYIKGDSNMAQKIKKPMTTLRSLKYIETPMPSCSISFTFWASLSLVREKNEPVGALRGIFSNFPSTALLG